MPLSLTAPITRRGVSRQSQVTTAQLRRARAGRATTQTRLSVMPPSRPRQKLRFRRPTPPESTSSVRDNTSVMRGSSNFIIVDYPMAPEKELFWRCDGSRPVVFDARKAPGFTRSLLHTGLLFIASIVDREYMACTAFLSCRCR